MNLNSNNEHVALLGLLQSESYFRFNIEQYAQELEEILSDWELSKKKENVTKGFSTSFNFYFVMLLNLLTN